MDDLFRMHQWHIVAWGLIFLRILPIVRFVPVFGFGGNGGFGGYGAENGIVKMAVAWGLTIFVWPLAVVQGDLLARLSPSIGILLLICLKEVAVGYIMGLMIYLIFAVLESFASMVGWTFREMNTVPDEMPLLRPLSIVAFGLIFLMIQGPMHCIESIRTSYDAIPLTLSTALELDGGKVIEISGRFFLGALLIALPFLLTMLLWTLMESIGTRLLKHIHFRMLALPLRTLLVLLVFVVSLPFLFRFFITYARSIFEILQGSGE